MRISPRLLAGVVAGGLLLTACGEEAPTEENLVDMLTRLGDEDKGSLDPAQAECIAAQLFDRYDEEEIDAIANADDGNLPAGAEDAIREAVDACPAG